MDLKITDNTPRIETDRLILRQFSEQDAAALFRILSDRETNTFLPWFPLESLEETKKLLQEKYLQYYRQPSGFRYAICLKTDDMPIGYLHVSDEDSHDLGYGLRSDCWHRGLATEACLAVIDRLRAAGLPYITATHDRNNPKSGAVMQKIGMSYQYSYQEQWQPKNKPVIFRLYQLNLDGHLDRVYRKYWDAYPHFIETQLDKSLPASESLLR
ncbi:MAG TPA: GNAT family N-acetyltransferase [Firmicutes bacterium]|nr:GNAT family N-acetyltransferase [Bacillota bacterium]